MASRQRLLILTQVYVPDPASVGQHLADAASEVARRGFPVRVLTSACGYDDPSVRYPARQTLDGVDVVRVPLSSFGKKSLWTRLAAQGLFLAQTLARGALTPDLGAVLVSTSPPMASAAALVIATLRRVPLVYWAMDINPDQAVALGAFAPDALPVRLLDALNRLVLGRAKAVVTLDRFMADRLNRKRDVTGKLQVFPPWPHENPLGTLPHADNPFRHRHGLDGRTVIMYSGNHGPSNPIRTLLDAAERLKDRKDIVFAFIGGGVGKKEVADAIARGAGNLLDLPYQPMAELRNSLSAADAHVVTLGDGVVGIVHPCKVYGAMAVARPLLYVGPRPSHVSDLLDHDDIGWQAAVEPLVVPNIASHSSGSFQTRFPLTTAFSSVSEGFGMLCANDGTSTSPSAAK